MQPTNEDAVWLLEEYGEKYSMTTLLEAAKEFVTNLRNIGIGTDDPVSGGDCVEVCGEHISKLDEAIAVEEDATVKPARGKRKIISVSERAYDTIIETLTLDSQAGNFDKDLRAEIKKAIKDIREESPEVRIDVHKGCADVSKAPAYVEVRIVDHDNH